MVTFEGGKNSRDVLGPYYPGKTLQKEIARKAIDDFCYLQRRTRYVLRIFHVEEEHFWYQHVKYAMKRPFSRDIWI